MIILDNLIDNLFNNISLDDIISEAFEELLKEHCEVTLLFKNGCKERFNTPLSAEAFIDLWDKSKRKIRVPTGKDSYITIKKKDVQHYSVRQLNN